MKRPLSKSYQATLLEALKKPEEAAAYLSAALEEKDPSLFLVALRNVVEAWGGVGKISKKSKLNRENLYRILSTKGNPELLSLEALLSSMSLRLAVEARIQE